MAPQRSVPFFNYPGLFEEKREDYLRIFEDVGKRGAFILQKDLEEFESNLATFVGAKHAFGVADGTEALILSLLAVDIGAGDEVIVPSHTFIASAAAIHFVGATPVLAECGPDHLIDTDHAKTLINERTKGIMPVQLNGRTANMDAVLALASAHDLIVVEDSAQALGSKFNGRNAGTFGAAGTFSFYPAKVLGCFGDGGAVVTNNDKVAARISELRDHGRGASGEIESWGVNSRLDNLQAAFLNFKLKTFPQDVTRRREIAARYHEGLKEVAALHLPPAPDSDPAHFDVFQNYELEGERRDDLQTHLREKGVGTLVQWGGKAVHQWKGLEFRTELPKTDRLFERCLMIPIYPILSNDDVDYVIEQIRNFYH